MPWENVGSCGTGQIPADKDWIVQCYEMALSYMAFVLPSPPSGCELGLMWHEHELGNYPSIGLYWDSPQSDPPWSYLTKCEKTLALFDEAIDWSEIDPEAVARELDGDDAEQLDE